MYYIVLFGNPVFHIFASTLWKCWVVSTQIWVKYGQTYMLG